MKKCQINFALELMPTTVSQFKAFIFFLSKRLIRTEKFIIFNFFLEIKAEKERERDVILLKRFKADIFFL